MGFAVGFITMLRSLGITENKRRIQPFNYFIWTTVRCNFYGVVPFNSRIYSKNMIKVKIIMCRTTSCCYCCEDYRA